MPMRDVWGYCDMGHSAKSYGDVVTRGLYFRPSSPARVAWSWVPLRSCPEAGEEQLRTRDDGLQTRRENATALRRRAAIDLSMYSRRPCPHRPGIRPCPAAA